MSDGNPVMAWIVEATDTLDEIIAVRTMPVHDLFDWLLWKRKQRHRKDKFTASLAGVKLNG